MDSINIESMRNEHIIRIRFAIKLLILVVFLGYIIIWIMMPTNVFWLHWLPNIHATADSTYFGQQGANILIYTFPVLFIAVLGCLYLHLEKYSDDVEKGNTPEESCFASWRQPVLVKGPLGVVSWTELWFLLMFAALLVWSFSSYVHNMFKNVTRQSAAKMGESVWEVKLDSFALLLGLVGNICLSFLFFPVSRGSSILRLIGLTSESSIKYHIWIGHIVLALFTSHGLCFAVFWAKTNQLYEMLKWDGVGISNLGGEIALLCGLAMWITSSSLVRQKLFELFYYTHHLYVGFVVFFVFHAGFSYFCITLPGFYLFLIDRFLRFLQSQQRVRLISARVLPCRAVELNFSKDPRLTYNPASIMFINVKSISKLQWHPFTVTSNNNIDRDQLSIVIKSEGSWSQKLYEKLSSPTPMDHLEISVEGPYGPTATSLLRHEKLVLVSGGSGITPFISIIRELVYTANTKENTPSIILVAAFKNSEDLTMLDFLLPLSGTSFDISRLRIQIKLYITRERNPSTEIKKLHQSIWFKPSASDKPVSSVLGPNNWIWLGAIISSSFILFLILIGVINQYYIYPIDHNTNLIYSNAAKSTISIVCLCVSVVIVAILPFLWNKKQKTKNTMQIQNADTPTPMASPVPGLWGYQVERELESVPHQSFEGVTTVHYGRRPDFKKILCESEESNVGVLVSGPKKMRQDVAAICSSPGAVKRLHYESFSFSW